MPNHLECPSSRILKLCYKQKIVLAKKMKKFEVYDDDDESNDIKIKSIDNVMAINGKFTLNLIEKKEQLIFKFL